MTVPVPKIIMTARVCILLDQSTYCAIYTYIYIYILYSNQVVPGQAGGGSFKFETLKRFSPIERNKDCGYK